MNLRHAAALALVGWYLIIPVSSKQADLNAPLSKWKRWETYNSADSAKCEYDRQGLLDVMGMNWDSVDSPGKPAFVKAQCIKSDDPRLKEK
jgi:hypothetical protein